MKILSRDRIFMSLLCLGIFSTNPSGGYSQTRPEESEQELPAKFVADGDFISLQKLGLYVVPPKGWTVYADQSKGPSLVFEEPKKLRKKVKRTTTTYQRNITISVRHEATPIDEEQAMVLASQLETEFAKKASVRDFTILEQKLVDLGDGDKGILVYSSYRMGRVDMLQMHVFVSGSDKQYLQTYTDMAKRFSRDDAYVNAAWNSMVLIQVDGDAPIRYQQLIKWGSVAGGCMLLILLIGGLKKRRSRRVFAGNIDDIESGLLTDEDSCFDIDTNTNTNTNTLHESSGWATLDLELSSVPRSDSISSRQSAEGDRDFRESRLRELAVTEISPLRKPTVSRFSRRRPSTVPRDVQPGRDQWGGFDFAPETTIDTSEWVVPTRTRVSGTRISSHS